MAEWLKALDSKSSIRVKSVSRVRIPPSPPIYNFSVFEGCCLALASLWLGKDYDFIRIFKIRKQFLLQNLKVRTNRGNFALFKGIYEIDGRFEPIIVFCSITVNSSFKSCF